MSRVTMLRYGLAITVGFFLWNNFKDNLFKGPDVKRNKFNSIDPLG